MPSPKKKPAAKPAGKARKKPPAARDLNKAEAFYVESHFGQLPPQKIAADLGIPVAAVQKYIDQLREANFRPKARETPVEKVGFVVKNGSVQMSKKASEAGDDFRGVTADGKAADDKRRGPNTEFLRKRVPGLHIINPDLPSY